MRLLKLEQDSAYQWYDTVMKTDIKLAAQRVKDVLINIEAGVFDNNEQANEALLVCRADIEELVDYIIKNVVDCNDCNGARVIDCMYCNGRGWFGYSEWSIENWCDQCNHTGRVPCQRCR